MICFIWPCNIISFIFDKISFAVSVNIIVVARFCFFLNLPLFSTTFVRNAIFTISFEIGVCIDAYCSLHFFLTFAKLTNSVIVLSYIIAC